MTSLLGNTFIQFKCKNCDWTFETHWTKPEALTALQSAKSHATKHGHYVDYSRTHSEVITP